MSVSSIYSQAAAGARRVVPMAAGSLASWTAGSRLPQALVEKVAAHPGVLDGTSAAGTLVGLAWQAGKRRFGNNDTSNWAKGVWGVLEGVSAYGAGQFATGSMREIFAMIAATAAFAALGNAYDLGNAGLHRIKAYFKNPAETGQA